MKNYYINSITNIIKESSKGYDILPINDSLLQKREVFLVDRVDTKTMNDTIKQILYLSRESPYEERGFWHMCESPIASISCYG